MSNGYKISKFKQDQNPKDWLNAFNTGCKILRVEEKDKLDHVPGYLNQKASRWFYDHSFEDWKQFEKEFEDRFTNETRVSAKSLITKILNMKKKSDESVREYNDRFDHLVRKFEKKTSKSKVGEEELRDAYVAGLRPKELRSFVKRANPSGLKCAKNLAKEEEDRSAESDESDSDTGLSNDEESSSSEDSDSSDEEDAKKNKAKRNELKSKNSQSATRKSIRSKNRVQEHKTNSKDPVEEVTNLMKNLTLLIQTQNSQPQSYRNQPVSKPSIPQSRLCYNCQSERHIARDCRPCKYCKGSEGDHVFWECKQYPKKSNQPPSSTNNFLMISSNQSIPSVNDDTTYLVADNQANFETYAAEKRTLTGSDRDIRVSRSGKKIKVHDTTVRDKISPFFGFFAMPRRELSLELCFADEKFVSSFNKVDNICRKWYFLFPAML